MFSPVLKPEYIFRPTQLLRRLAFAMGAGSGDSRASTPWGAEITFDPQELHGQAMLKLGLSDLRANEVIARLVRPGDTAVDIGANIGIMTSMMSVCAGPKGHVYAFEPHPVTRGLLEENVAAWARHPARFSTVQVSGKAVSDTIGVALLREPEGFSANAGTATIAPLGHGASSTGRQLAVETIVFDEWATAHDRIRFVKIDVEGHEDAVLAGMERSLLSGKIDCILYEELRDIPSSAVSFLAACGYQQFMVDRNFWGIVLRNVEDRPASLAGEATNILAIRSDKELNAFGTGWRCLSRRRAS